LRLLGLAEYLSLSAAAAVVPTSGDEVRSTDWLTPVVAGVLVRVALGTACHLQPAIRLLITGMH